MAEERGKARTRVAVVFGGRSSEHAISCISAGSVLAALDRDRFDVVPVGITPGGRWVLEADDSQRLRLVDGVLPAVDPSGAEVVLRAGGELVTLADGVVQAIDVVFPVMHGPWGEDGTVQGLLELMGVPYVGSGVFASAAGMDKAHMKAMLASAGLPIGPYEVVTARQWAADETGCLSRCSALLAAQGGSLFVKPARAGSSVGISRITSKDALREAVAQAHLHDPKVVVEAGIEGGREVECAVLVDESGPRASVCAEIVVGGNHDFYDFEAKYLDDAAELIVPASLPPGVQERVQQLAIEAFEALDCEGLARVDFFVLPDGSAVVNEVNTMPGFTSISMYPRMWSATGVDYPALVAALVDDALRRGTGLR